MSTFSPPIEAKIVMTIGALLIAYNLETNPRWGMMQDIEPAEAQYYHTTSTWPDDHPLSKCCTTKEEYWGQSATGATCGIHPDSKICNPCNHKDEI